MRHTTEDFANLVSDLIFEVRSKTDVLASLRTKIRQFLDLGTTVGALVNYRTQTIEVHRRLTATEIYLSDFPDTLTQSL